MKIYVFLFVILFWGCGSSKDNPNEISNLLIYPSSTYSHPLIGGHHPNYPSGVDVIFQKKGGSKINPDSYVHAVFPTGLDIPKSNKSPITLKGEYKILNPTENQSGIGKKVIENYKYFVVNTWKHQ